MLPWIAGAIAVSVGAYLLDDAGSKNSSAKKRYKKERRRSKARVNAHYENAQKKDTLDKLFKVKRAKQEIANAIYYQLKNHYHNFEKVNSQLKESKDILSNLFLKKKSVITQKEKKEIQNNINIITNARKEIFGIKDELKSDIVELKVMLEEANQETKRIQDEINRVLEK